MSDRGYTLIDFAVPPGLYPDRDRVVRFIEYVRANLHRIVNGLPPECEVDIFASGHAHNPGLWPLLGVWIPPDLLDRKLESGHWSDVPDRWIDEASAWCSRLSAAQVETIVRETPAPTWEELVRLGVYPPRKPRAVKRPTG